MKLEKWALIAEIGGAGAVVLSVIRVESHHRLPESQLRPVGESSEQR